MLNFIESLSKNYNLYVFSIDDSKSIQDNTSKITYYTYKKKSGFYSKIINHTFFWRSYNHLVEIVKDNLLSKDIDIILCHDLPTLMPSVRLKNTFQARLIYDSLEIYTETINQFFPGVSGVKKKFSKVLISFMKYFGSRAESEMMNYCDDIITVNSSLANYFKEKYNQKEIKVIMNCPKLVEQKVTEIDFRIKFGFKKEDFIFIYQGVLNEGRGLTLLVDSFFEISKINPNIKLVILGDGVLKQILINKVENLKINKTIVFHDSVLYKDLFKYTLAADYGVNLLQSFNLSKKLASPNKLFEYMQAEIPVLCSFSPENDLIFKKFNIGLQCENKIDDILKKVLKLIENQKKYPFLYKKELQSAKNKYSWEQQEVRLLEIFE